MYLKSLVETIIGWAAGGAAGALAAVASTGGDLTAGPVWKGALIAAAAGVIKGLAARYAGPNRESATLTS